MSQITRIGGSGPTPGGAVLTLSGDGGPTVSPNGGGNIDIDGAGGITVIGHSGTNSLTISGAGLGASSFSTDIAGPVVPTVGGELEIIGVAPTGHYSPINIQTTGATANTVGIYLEPNVLINSLASATYVSADTLHADLEITTGGTIEALGTITTDTGDLVLAAGEFVVGGNAGTAGQVLTSEGPAAVPTWQTIAAPSGSTVSSFFARQSAATGLVTGNNSGTYIWLGAPGVLTIAPGDCFNTGGNLTLGDGVGTSAKYTAPLTGTYFFNFQVALFANSYAAPANNSLCINNITQGISYYSEHYSFVANTSSSGSYYGQPNYSAYIKLTAGDIVQFGVIVYISESVPALVGITNSVAIATTTYHFTATTFVSGFKVA